MKTKTWNRRGVGPAVLAAVVMAGAMSWPPHGAGVQAQAGAARRPPVPANITSPADERRPVQADLRLLHRLRTADGHDLGAAAPGVTLHLDRRSYAGRWRTSLSLTGIEKPEVRSARGVSLLDNPFLITRLEYDDDGVEPRVYDRLGRRVHMPGTSERRALGLPASLRQTTWDVDVVAAKVPVIAGAGGAPAVASGLLAPSNRREARRQQIHARFGAPVGRVRGLDRFVATRGDTTEEVLVSPDGSVPVEVNTVQGGVLVSRVQLEYQPIVAGDLVRKAMRIEQVVDPASGARLATDVEVAHLTVGQGGGQ